MNNKTNNMKIEQLFEKPIDTGMGDVLFEDKEGLFVDDIGLGGDLGLGSGGIEQGGDSGVGVFDDDLGLGSGGIEQGGDSGVGVFDDDLGLGSGGIEQGGDSGVEALPIDELHLQNDLSQYEGMIVYDSTDWAIFLIENGYKRWYSPAAWEIELRNGQQKEIPHKDLARFKLGTSMPEKKVLVDDLIYDQLDLPKVDTLSCEQISDYLNAKIKFPANISPNDSKRQQDFFNTITEKYNSVCRKVDNTLPEGCFRNEYGNVVCHKVDNTLPEGCFRNEFGNVVCRKVDKADDIINIKKEPIMTDLEKMSCGEINKEIESITNTLMTARLLESNRNELEKRLENAKILKAKCDLIADQPPIVKTDVLSNNLKPIVIGLGIVVGLLVVSKLLKD